MYRKLHILIILLAFLAGHSAFSQDRRVCVGVKEMYKADGLEGSTFEYDVPTDGAKLLDQYPDSIVVEWGMKKGIYQLGVREISQFGCYGDWAYLDVQVVGSEIIFEQNIYTICSGEGVQVEFNDADFQAYEWGDADVNASKGYITEPGKYELKTIDWDQCRTSSWVTVNSAPQPVVNLGRDTMICTSDFSLAATKHITDNPEGTVYTWSNGKSDTSPFLDIRNHDTNRDAMIWVRADIEGCSASDTVIILACVENLDIPNTFTPNGDGDNDVWEIKVLQNFPNAIVEVFDRWGRKVFTSTKGYTQAWDGRDSKRHYLPMETYYYIITLNDARDTKPIIGTITIVR